MNELGNALKKCGKMRECFMSYVKEYGELEGCSGNSFLNAIATDIFKLELVLNSLYSHEKSSGSYEKN